MDNIMTKNPFKSSKKYDIVILAVTNDVFNELKKEDFDNITKGNLVLLDLKNVYNFATWKF